MHENFRGLGTHSSAAKYQSLFEVQQWVVYEVLGVRVRNASFSTSNVSKYLITTLRGLGTDFKQPKSDFATSESLGRSTDRYIGDNQVLQCPVAIVDPNGQGRRE